MKKLSKSCQTFVNLVFYWEGVRPVKKEEEAEDWWLQDQIRLRRTW
jgi:hypothetical protein